MSRSQRHPVGTTLPESNSAPPFLSRSQRHPSWVEVGATLPESKSAPPFLSRSRCHPSSRSRRLIHGLSPMSSFVFFLIVIKTITNNFHAFLMFSLINRQHVQCGEGVSFKFMSINKKYTRVRINALLSALCPTRSPPSRVVRLVVVFCQLPRPFGFVSAVFATQQKTTGGRQQLRGNFWRTDWQEWHTMYEILQREFCYL